MTKCEARQGNCSDIFMFSGQIYIILLLLFNETGVGQNRRGDRSLSDKKSLRTNEKIILLQQCNI